MREAGAELVPVVWDGPAERLDGLDAVVVRSCWDYHHRPQAFLEWVDGLGHRGLPVFNPAPVIAWNLDKRYLRDLAGQGVPLPPTVWLERGDPAGADLAGLLAANGMDEAVVKPAVSLSAYQTWRVSRADAPARQAEFARLVAERAVLLQAYVPEVTVEGELSLMFFGGEYSHAVRKRPKAGDFRVQEDFGGTRESLQPSAAVIAQAQGMLDCVAAPLVYARVDGIEAGGRFVLMELELIDPFLFLRFDQAAPARFAAAIERALGG